MPRRSGRITRRPLAARSAFMSRLVAALFVAACCAPSAKADPLEFHLTFDRKALDKPFTGRAHVMLFANDEKELKDGPDSLRTEPFFARDVKGVKPGEV